APCESASQNPPVPVKKPNAPPTEPSCGSIPWIGAFARLTTMPIKATAFTDTNIDLAKPQKISGEPIYERKFNREQFDESGRAYRFAVFAYRIRVVNAPGVESGPSPTVFTIPSA